MGRGIDEDLAQVLEHLAGDGVHPGDPLDLVAPVLEPHDRLLVRREHLEGVTPDAEGPPGEVHLVAVVLDVDESLDRLVEGELDAPYEAEELPLVVLG